MTKRKLPPDEAELLEWLGKDDFSQYGECHGRNLDALVAKGLAQIHDDGADLVAPLHVRGNFIAKGTGRMYRAVSLTDQGIAELLKLRAAKPRKQKTKIKPK